MKKLIVLFVLTIATQAFAYQGIEECRDSRGEVHSVAHAVAGLMWTYTYRGTQYDLLALDLLQKPANQLPVEHVAEQITSVKCNGHELVERNSVRTVALRDSNFKTVVQAELQCVGSFAMPPLVDLCP